MRKLLNFIHLEHVGQQLYQTNQRQKAQQLSHKFMEQNSREPISIQRVSSL